MLLGFGRLESVESCALSCGLKYVGDHRYSDIFSTDDLNIEQARHPTPPWNEDIAEKKSAIWRHFRMICEKWSRYVMSELTDP